MTNTWSDWMDRVASQGPTGNSSNTITAFTPDPVGGPIRPLQLAPALGAHVDPLQPACEGTQGAEHVHNLHPKGQAGPSPEPCPVSDPCHPKPGHTRFAGYNPDHNPGASGYLQP